MDIVHNVVVQQTLAEDEEDEDSIRYERVLASASYLLERTKHRPRIAIICGSGLAGLADLLDDCDVFDYSDIPNFPETTVPGHKSRLLMGNMRGVEVMLMQGRFHAYEGHPLGKCAMPVRVMKLCGIDTLIVTNAAGGVNPEFRVGDIMILKDHINLPGFTGIHPLKGPNDQRFGQRFFGLNNCYDRRLRHLAVNVGNESSLSTRIHQGVYAMLVGPNYETVAEVRMLKMCGVDAVGMSTIPEVLVARHCGIHVFAFSLITNMCSFDDEQDEVPNHEEVLQMANEKQDDIRHFVASIVAAFSQQQLP